MTSTTNPQSLQDEIADLEQRLRDAKFRLQAQSQTPPTPSPPTLPPAHLHALLLLSDSALPLGSFAFSSGLESYLAHHKPSSNNTSTISAALSSFHTFLRLSLATLATTSLPYVLSAYRNPENLYNLDNDFDASTPCTVARRASIAQGRALMTVWERSFRAGHTSSNTLSTLQPNSNEHPADVEAIDVAINTLTTFSKSLRTHPDTTHAHYAPLWGLVTRILHLSAWDAGYLFLFSHARTVLSAAVRASVMGPYQAQAVLASVELQERIRGLVEEGWEVRVEDAGVCVPVMDLWVGRHERLYSRIFNS
ncbi:hypothetical protein M011DRAFT_484131 [Sporormia fimetaria CBS 119925]|uniref:Urease accessory protein UreF n=1 Tax=Sporormia fimetaria CBS 119925 TaxID=1340428 RepID=A0A6A6VKN2_9PLEO|nr:hypothetical protein M011DRAFT_484131 [Sporormia fimetaria CBS 119925]